jgi:rhomboid protease GluP
MSSEDVRTAPNEGPPEGPYPEALVRLALFRRALFTSTPRVFVTQALVAINCAVFVVMVCTGVSLMTPDVKELIRWGANYGPRTINGEWWRLLTATFIHSGIIHLGLNMVILYNAGMLVERLLGNLGFLVMYLVSGVLASVASLLIHPDIASVGASGAVFGVIGALGGFLLRQRHAIPREVLQPLGKNVLLFIVLNLAFSLAVPRVDMSAHVGGLIAGFLCGLVQARQLDRPSALGRAVRNGLTAIGGAGLLFLAVMVLSRNGAPSDFLAIDEHFWETERKVVNRYSSAIKQAREDKMSDRDFARILADEILPEWSKATEEVAQVHGLSGREAELFTKMKQYAVERQEAWQLMIEALHEGNRGKFDQSQAKEKQAIEAMQAALKER